MSLVLATPVIPVTTETTIAAVEVLEAESDRCFEQGNLELSLALQEQAMAMRAQEGNMVAEANCAHNVGYLNFLTKKYDAAIAAYGRTVWLAKFIADGNRLANAYGRLAEVFQFSARHLDALQAFDLSMEQLRQKGRLKEIGIVLNNMAVSHRELGRRNEAVACHERALEIRRALSDHDGLAASLHNMGVLYGDEGQYEQALRALQESEELRIELGDKAGLARTTLRLGMLQEQQGELRKAYALYENALELARDPALLLRDDEAAALNNMGGILIAQGVPGEALTYLLEAQALLKDAATPGHALIHFNLGVAWSALGNHALARISYLAAKALQEQFSDAAGQAASAAAIGVTYLREHEHDLAQTWLNEALHRQTGSGDDRGCASTLLLLAQLKEKQACPDEATACYKQAEMLSRPVLPTVAAAAPLVSAQQWELLARNAGYASLALH
ncbi:MAG: tetratricopeptide repeat protein [Janthinobacterium lividum]